MTSPARSEIASGRTSASSSNTSPGVAGAISLLFRSAAGHGLDEIGGIERSATHQGGDAAVAEYGAAVGELHDLFQPVRHIDDGGALT